MMAQDQLFCVRSSPGDSVVKNLPAMPETWVRSLGREDPLEKEMATHSSILAWKSHGQRSLAGYGPWDHKELDMPERLSLAFSFHRSSAWLLQFNLSTLRPASGCQLNVEECGCMMKTCFGLNRDRLYFLR